ncbi:MAG: c-type cytochrome [Myxococcaceae bacterium]
MSEAKENGTETPHVHHVFDGIVEHDNRLPNWWLGILWGTMLFAFAYWFYYHPSGYGTDQMERYEAEVAELKALQEKNAPKVDDAALAALVTETPVVEQGKQLFAQQCAACHATQGQGLIGPNLTDRFWLHGAKPIDIHKTIADGVVAKGMPAWAPTLGADRVKQLTAYVLTLKGTNVPGKEPQGEAME